MNRQRAGVGGGVVVTFGWSRCEWCCCAPAAVLLAGSPACHQSNAFVYYKREQIEREAKEAYTMFSKEYPKKKQTRATTLSQKISVWHQEIQKRNDENDFDGWIFI